jgi:hypothetical protein
LSRWCPRGRAGVTVLYQDGGGRLPARASPILSKMSEQRRLPSESERGGRRESSCGRTPGQGLGGAAAAPALVRNCQTLSPVGAQKLPPYTLKQHSTTFPRVTKILICAAQGRKLGPGIAQAFPTRRAGEGAGVGGNPGGRFPRGPPAPLSSPLLGDQPRVSLGLRGRRITGTAGGSLTLTF